MEIEEYSAIVYATHRQHMLAIDDKVATNAASELSADLEILSTHNIMVSLIKEGILDVREVDNIKGDWESKHKFKMKIDSFGSIEK